MPDRSAAEAFSSLLREPAFLRKHRLSSLAFLKDHEAPVLAKSSPVIAIAEEDKAAGVCAFTLGSDFALPALESAFASLVPADDQESARHYAFLTGAVCIRIPTGVTLSYPVSIQWKGSEEWTSTHTVIIADTRSRATVIESFSGGSGSWSHVTELIAAEEAVIDVTSLQNADSALSLWMQQRSRIGAGATVTWNNATLGGKEVHHNLQSEAVGDSAMSGINWLFYAKGTERHQLSARNIFRASNGGGEILMKGVAEGRSHVIANGMIDIGLRGSGTNTYLTQEVLMLDASAKVDAIPGLEIKTNDVKASHSATVARVTEEDLFYFAARGIERDEARGMFVKGFLGDLVAKVGDESVREEVLGFIERKYGT